MLAAENRPTGPSSCAVAFADDLAREDRDHAGPAALPTQRRAGEFWQRARWATSAPTPSATAGLKLLNGLRKEFLRLCASGFGAAFAQSVAEFDAAPAPLPLCQRWPPLGGGGLGSIDAFEGGINACVAIAIRAATDARQTSCICAAWPGAAAAVWRRRRAAAAAQMTPRRRRRCGRMRIGSGANSGA